MMSINSPTLFANRYHLDALIGEGGMGAVYRATDRLTGERVALKRVLTPLSDMKTASMNTTGDLLVTLAHEFQTLASLRHPHIISVLDYGFDPMGQPFYTMELLDEPLTIVEAAKYLPLADKLHLLIQSLQALAYLHRRGILHRDLKPANVLVQRGAVKLVDFGLAAHRDNVTDSIVGTMTYIAPELLKGATVPTPESDLYAMGVIAYEALAQQYPFDISSITYLLIDVMNTAPDMEPLLAIDGLSPEVVTVIDRLLAKKPHQRYPSAEAVIQAFSSAAGIELDTESEAIRESYLQAAAFVGRKREQTQLETALFQAIDGAGSAWLVGGESGVGKTRLLNELRNVALTKGAVVMRGQGVVDGGLAYQLWREPVQRLTLQVELSDLEATILKEIVPDIERLIGRPVAGEMDNNPQRLIDTIASAFSRITTPIVLILEDLQWADESLTVLKRLLGVVSDRPLLILGSYRNDERPQLPDELKGIQHLRLDRLSAQSIAELTQSMLGDTGKRPELLDLLQRETEGNVFFLVEVVRALAEEAGGLRDIGDTLPRRVFAGGIQTVIQRRLKRVPSWGQGLLQLIAIAGREVDLKLLQGSAWQADEGHTMDEWLVACLNAVVLEIREQRWQFTHDKLREGVLSSINAEQRPALHRQVALALEKVYPELVDYAGALRDHWAAAGDTERERHYATLAGRRSYEISAYQDAKRSLLRALELTPEADQQARANLLHNLGDVYDALSEREDAIAAYTASLDLARASGDRHTAALALHGLGSTHSSAGQYQVSMDNVQEALQIGRELGDREIECLALVNLASTNRIQGEVAKAIEYHEQAVAVAATLSNPRYRINALNGLGNTYLAMGQSDKAIEYYLQLLPLARQSGDKRRENGILGNLGLAYITIGRSEDAIAQYQQAIPLAASIGDRRSQTNHLSNLGLAYLVLGRSEEGIQQYEQAAALASGIGHVEVEIGAQVNLSILYLDIGDVERAIQAGRTSIEQARAIQNPMWECYAAVSLGWALLTANQIEEAVAILSSASQLKAPSQVVQKAVVALGVAYARQGDHATSQATFEQAARQASQLLEKAPDFYEAWYTLGLAQAGLALLGNGALDEARTAYQKGRELAGQTGVLADAQRQVDELGKANLGDLASIIEVIQEHGRKSATQKGRQHSGGR